MKVFSLAALLAACVIGVVASGTPFQPAYPAGQWSGRPGLRISGLNFVHYDPTVEYAAFLCDFRLTLNSLNAEYVTAQIDYLPAGPADCPFSIWDVAAEKRVYLGEHVSFVAGQPSGLYPAPLLMSPSFFFADSKSRTRVTVVTTPPSASVVTRVESTAGLGSCTDIITLSAGGFSCLLTPIAQSHFSDGDSLTYVATTSSGEYVQFAIQALRTEVASVTSVHIAGSFRYLHSGARLTITLSQPLASASRLPWAPVLIDRRSNTSVADATFSDISWAADGRSLEATLTCFSCAPTEHSVALGEVLRGTSPPLAAAVTADTAPALSFRELSCTFVGAAFPAQIPRGALAVDTADKAATLFIPIDLDTAPHPVRFVVEIGDKAVAHDTRVVRSAQRGSAVLAVSLWSFEGDRPAGGLNSLTIAAQTYGGTIERCSVSKAFEVVEHATDDAVVYGISQRVYFFGPAGQPDTVTITGANLNTVAMVRLRLDDAASLGGLFDELPECAIVFIQNDLIRCTLPTDAVVPPGPMSFDLFPNDGKTLLATVSDLYSDTLPTVKFAPASISAHSVGRIVTTRTLPLPSAYPLSLTLVTSAGTAYGTAQFQNEDDTVTVFNDAFFTEPATVQLAVTERLGYSGDVLVQHTFPGKLTVTPAKQVINARVFPSHVQTGTIAALGAGKSLLLRVDIDEFAALKHDIKTVRTSPGSVEDYFVEAGTLVVAVSLKAAAGPVSLTLLGAKDSVLLEIPKAIIVEDNAPQPAGPELFVLDGAYTALVSHGEAVLEMLVRAAPGTPPNVKMSQGAVKAVEAKIVDGETLRLLVSATGLWGDSVTATVGAGTTVTAPFELFPLPSFESFWPQTLDFSTIDKHCIPFGATFDAVSARRPFSIALRGNPGVVVTASSVDESTSTVVGCLQCHDCKSGAFSVAIVPIRRPGFPISPASTEIITVAVTAPARRATSLAGELDDGGFQGTDFTSPVSVISLACAAVVLVAVTVGFALRRRQQALRAKPVVSELASDSAASEVSYTAI